MPGKYDSIKKRNQMDSEMVQIIELVHRALNVTIPYVHKATGKIFNIKLTWKI